MLFFAEKWEIGKGGRAEGERGEDEIDKGAAQEYSSVESEAPWKAS
jgi:hypothetical protein